MRRALSMWAVCAGLLFASSAGCAGLKTSESQLFGTESRYHSATVTYRVVSQPPAQSSATRKFLDRGPTSSGAGRTVILAVRYPHPAGRAGYARVECVVERQQPRDAAHNGVSGWLQRARHTLDQSMPGVKFGEGVDEAMGLDVPIGDLQPLLARLEQPPVPAATPSPHVAVQVVGSVNGAAIAPRTTRMTELDQLSARVRRDGSIISHSLPWTDSIRDLATDTIAQASPAVTAPVIAAPAAAPLPSAANSVVPASYAEPSVRRLPPVE